MSRKPKIPENPSNICPFCERKCKNWKGRQTHEGQYCKKNPASKSYDPQDAPTEEPEVSSPLASEVTPTEVIEAEEIIDEARDIEDTIIPTPFAPEPEPTAPAQPVTPPPQAQPQPQIKPEPTPEPEPEPKGKETDWTKIGAMVLVIIAIICIVVGIYLLWKNKNDKAEKEKQLKASRQPQQNNNAPRDYNPGEYPDV